MKQWEKYFQSPCQQNDASTDFLTEENEQEDMSAMSDIHHKLTTLRNRKASDKDKIPIVCRVICC